MNSLEFIRNKISKKIKTINQKRNVMINCKNMNIPFNPDLTYEDEKELEYLRQIETELEAWETIKHYLVVDERYVNLYENDFKTIELKNGCIDELESGEDYEKVNKIIKALEVKDER